MKGIEMHYVNISIGIPAMNPYISRPLRPSENKDSNRNFEHFPIFNKDVKGGMFYVEEY